MAEWWEADSVASEKPADQWWAEDEVKGAEGGAPSAPSPAPSPPSPELAPESGGLMSWFQKQGVVGVLKTLDSGDFVPTTWGEAFAPSPGLKSDVARSSVPPPSFADEDQALTPPMPVEGSNFAFWHRGVARTQRDAQAGLAAAGLISPEEAARNYVFYENEAKQYQYDPEVVTALRSYPEQGSASEVLSWMWNNPKATATMFGDNLAGVAVGAALPIGAGVAATPLGPGAQAAAFAGTAGISSGVMTAMSVISDELQDSGVDINSAEQVESAFASEEFMTRATKRAILHGVPVGVVDMITGLAGAKGVGGKIVEGAMKPFVKSVEGEAVRGTVSRAIAETGVNTAMDMGGAFIGELGGELASTGTYSWGQLIPETIFEAPGSIVQGAYETYLASKGYVSPADEKAIAAAGPGGVEPPPPGTPPVPQPVTVEEAQAEGRTLFGFAEPGKPVVVSPDYQSAERLMGEGEGRRGTLIAVKPEEAEGDVNDLTQLLVKQKADTGAVVDNLIANVPEQAKPAAAQAILKVVQAKDPGERSVAFEEARALGVKVPAGAKSAMYRGPIEERMITPRLDQPLRFGTVTINPSTNGEVTVQGSRISSETDLDGKRFFAALPRKAYISVQDVEESVGNWGRKAIEPMVQIADEQMREAVLGDSPGTVDPMIWKQAVRDGKVVFNLDGRLFLHGSRIGVMDATEAEVKAAVDAATIKLPKGAQRVSWQNQFEGRSSNYFRNDPRHQTDLNYFRNLKPGQIEVLNFYNPKFKRQAEMTKRVIQQLYQMFKLDTRLVLLLADGNSLDLKKKYPGTSMVGFLKDAGTHVAFGNELYAIHINLTRPDLNLYHTIAHEFGHHLSAARFSRASVKMRAKIFAAYRRWLEQIPGPNQTRVLRPFTHRKEGVGQEPYSINYNYGKPDYALNFEEWFAEQVARWATTRAKPLGMVSRFFKSLAQEIIRAVRKARKEVVGIKEDFTPEQEMDEFLSALLEGRHHNQWGAMAEMEFNAQTAERNRPYLGEDTVPLQAESTFTSEILGNAMKNSAQINPSTVASINAHNDRFLFFYKWGLTLRQVALRHARNPLLQPLFRYLEYVEQAKLEANKIMGDADQVLLKTRNLKGKARFQGKTVKMADLLGMFIDDLDNMVYLSPQERSQGVRRHPSTAEFRALARKYQLSNEAIALYTEVRDFFNQSIERFYLLDKLEAGKLSNPQAFAAAMKAADARRVEMLKAPYFPKTRYGTWAVTVRDANGKVVDFQLFESQRQQRQGWKLAESNKVAGEVVTVSELPEQAEPFIGIPPWLLDKINTLPGLTKLQKEWIEQLRYHLAPERSFAKHFLKRKNTAGYSLDWRRSFANYAFHHARNYARLKYGELARQETELLVGAEEEGRGNPFTSRVGNMMADHYKEFVNPSRDWAVLRSVTALFHLGFSPATAMMNLSQVPLVTAPFLASHFSDVKATKALMKAAGDLTTYYKKGTMGTMTGLEFKALNEAIRQGIIDESQAWQLASMSGGSKSKAKQAVREAWLKTTAAGMYAFSMAEQWNRRVSFRAAFNLAMENPDAEWVQSLRIPHSLQLHDLVNIQGGWTEKEALAFIAAKETVKQTQFDYSKTDRPRFMRGKAANLFAFYMFTQNMLFTMWNNPGAGARYMLAMALLAGPLGLVPDDIEDILNAVARQLFGKDFDLERYARGLVVDLVGKGEKSIPPDLILHGVSRYSYGIPWLASQAGVDWLPNVDRSKSIALNKVLPMGGITSLLRPSADMNRSVAQATQDAAGAAFGPGFAIFKALSATDLDLFDMRRWQQAMPRAAKNVTEAVRNFYNSGQIDRKGRMQVPYDRNDPQHMAELIALAMGYQPTRKTQFYERQAAIYEVDSYWSTRRTQLLQDAFTDKMDGDGDWEDTRKAIVEYNKAATQVDKKYAITPETLKRSFMAKQKGRREMEKGIPAGVNPGVVESVGSLYPEGNVIFEKRVK